MSDVLVPVRTDVQLLRRTEDIVLHTDDGLNLVGELSLPVEGEPRATLVCMHPLPPQGGFMDSHLIRKAAYRLPELSRIAVLRYNSRGTTSPRGTSDGHFEDGAGEQFDLAAAMAFVRVRRLPRVWMLGWSFGADMVLKYGLRHPAEGAILISPPLRWAHRDDVAAWAHADRPLYALVPGNDLFLPPEPARAGFAPAPSAHVEAYPGCVHLWVGERQTRIVLNRVSELLVPGSTPLPTEVDATRVLA
ncbi:MAG: alpha/beta hydrolase [Microbacteriaceae bacterium]|jgi:alpha/beta superfamily hydrolase|nr:alpha/beta hydrolase [Microbacteriaceae bacterium]MCI1207148.1 alpha/beta hydrolase [Microbacteriaceae bacterium]